MAVGTRSTFRATIGDIGTVLTTRLSDDDGYVDLSGRTVTFRASHRSLTDVFTVAAVPDPDQTTTPGLVSVTLDAAALSSASRQPGDHDVSWIVVDGATFHGTFPSTDPTTGWRDTLVLEDALP